MRNNDTGTVEYELTVAAAGLVTGCKVVESSGSAVLDEATCRHISQTARFKPLASPSTEPPYYRGRMRWVLDENEVEAKSIAVFAKGLSSDTIGSRTILGFEINTQGRVQSCTVLSSSGDTKLDKFGCELMIRKARYTPPENPLSAVRLSILWKQ